MSHFYLTGHGKAKNPVTVCGSKVSGLQVTANAWNRGVTVEVEHDPEAGVDVWRVFMNGGSRATQGAVEIASFSADFVTGEIRPRKVGA